MKVLHSVRKLSTIKKNVLRNTRSGWQKHASQNVFKFYMLGIWTVYLVIFKVSQGLKKSSLLLAILPLDQISQRWRLTRKVENATSHCFGNRWPRSATSWNTTWTINFVEVVKKTVNLRSGGPKGERAFNVVIWFGQSVISWFKFLPITGTGWIRVSFAISFTKEVATVWPNISLLFYDFP